MRTSTAFLSGVGCTLALTFSLGWAAPQKTVQKTPSRTTVDKGKATKPSRPVVVAGKKAPLTTEQRLALLEKQMKEMRTVVRVQQNGDVYVVASKSLRLHSGEHLSLNAKGNAGIAVANQLVVTAQGPSTLGFKGTATIISEKDVKITAYEDLELKSGKDMSTKAGGKLDVDVSKDLSITAKKDAKLKASAKLDLEGTNVTAKATGTASIQSGGALNLKGSLTRINNGSRPVKTTSPTVLVP